MNRKLVVVSSVVLALATLTGCGNSEIAELNNISALNEESEVSSAKLSATDKEAAVYAQVSNRTLLDLTTLEKADSTVEQEVVSYMNSVDAQLCGTLASKDGVIDECYTDYLLMEFEKTPYYWQRSEMNVRGVDTNSGSVVVDVTYNTLDYKKDTQSASYICKGEPDYDTKVKVRYEHWMSILKKKYSSGGQNYAADLDKFVSAYGQPSDIIASQSNDGLTDSIYTTGNQKTYTGLTDSEQEDSSATMTVRYVLVPNYTLGVNQGYNCEHMYMVNYKLDKDPTSGLNTYTAEGSATVADNVYKTLYAYYKCNDESDYDGLYKLTSKFSNLDKYYTDLFSTTYRKHENFTISIFDIKGTKITCGVTLSNKVRAKGSSMTYPIYNDKYYYTLELVDGTLQITNEVLISRELDGEPDIGTTKADTTGFTSSISLSNTDKQSLETLVSKFGVVQLLQDTTSDNFSDIIDTSISNSQVTAIKDSMTSLSGEKKVTWISSYLQGQSNYASIKCKELYQKDDNSIVEANVTYDFIKKGNDWFIYNYTVNNASKIDTTDLTTKNSLCVVSKSGVDSFVSQVVATSSDTSNMVSLDSIGTIYKYTEYSPNEKSGSQQTGLKVYSAETMSDSDMDTAIDTLFGAMSSSSSGNKMSASEVKSNIKSSGSLANSYFKEFTALYMNKVKNYVTSKEYSSKFNDLQSRVKDSFTQMSDTEKSTFNYLFVIAK